MHYTVDRSTPLADWTAKSTAKRTDVWLKHSPVLGGPLLWRNHRTLFRSRDRSFSSSFLMTDPGRVSQRLDSNTKYIYKILHLFFFFWAFCFDIRSFCCALFESTCKDIISRPEYIRNRWHELTVFPRCFNFTLNTKERLRKVRLSSRPICTKNVIWWRSIRKTTILQSGINK